MTIAHGARPECRPVVGVVGLGTMGGVMARHLLDAGYEVVGTDVATSALMAFEQAGGSPYTDALAVAGAADVVVLSLPSVAAFDEVIDRMGHSGGLRAGVVAETSTLPLDRKVHGRQVMSTVGVELCDCPISGTGAQMAAKDAVFYASGDPLALATLEPVLAACGKGVFNLGAFGNGTKLKLVANHLVTVHNASAAEAIALARAAGIDPSEALGALVAGAGNSRMLELRGPMMAAGQYEPPTMKVDVFMKDVGIIAAFGREVRCPLPVFAAAAELHLAAQACGWGGADTASVHAVVERLAGADRT